MLSFAVFEPRAAAMAYRLPLTAALLPLLAACAAQPAARAPAPLAAPVPAVTAPAAPHAPAGAASAPAAETAPVRPFPAPTLEALLSAEFAALRNRPDLALQQYLAVARETRDPNVVARAATIAQVLNQPESLELSRLWTETAPEAAEGWFLFSLNSLRQRQFEVAMPALDRLLELRPEADLEQLFIAALPPTQADRDALSASLEALSRHHPDNANLVFGLALLRAQSGQPAAALELASQAQRLRPASGQAVLLRAKMLTELSRSREAATVLREALRTQPDNHNLRLNLARALIRAGDLDGAEAEFSQLLQRQPDDVNLRLSLALVAFDNKHDDLARRELEALRDSDVLGDEANYFLGLLAQRQNRPEDALAAFEAVQPGNQYLPAQAEIVRLLNARGEAAQARERLASARLQVPELATSLYQLEAELMSENGDNAGAWEVLSAALAQQPDNLELRLSRAMVAEQLDELEAFEADVRTILKRNPDNASALNALGYTLADRGDRLDEAEALVRRAYAIKPDDPAIIDSMGWVKFRRGDAAGALVELRRAYALFPDDEVAAHLGEVLWSLGERAEARRIWAEALRQHPRSRHLQRVRARLDPESK